MLLAGGTTRRVARTLVALGFTAGVALVATGVPAGGQSAEPTTREFTTVGSDTWWRSPPADGFQRRWHRWRQHWR